MLKKKNYALLGLGILLGGTYEILKEKKRNEEKQEELEERISYLEEETTSNYDHILELSKEEVEGD